MRFITKACLVPVPVLEQLRACRSISSFDEARSSIALFLQACTIQRFGHRERLVIRRRQIKRDACLQVHKHGGVFVGDMPGAVSLPVQKLV